MIIFYFGILNPNSGCLVFWIHRWELAKWAKNLTQSRSKHRIRTLPRPSTVWQESQSAPRDLLTTGTEFKSRNMRDMQRSSALGIDSDQTSDQGHLWGAPPPNGEYIVQSRGPYPTMPFWRTAQENPAATLTRPSDPRRALARGAMFDPGPRASSFNGSI